MRRSLFIGCFVIMALAFSSSGFAAQKDAGDKAFQWPRILNIGTHGTGSIGFAITNGWGPMLGEHAGATVRVVPEDNEINRTMRLVKTKDLDIIAKSIGDNSVTFMGEEGYATMEQTPHSILWLFNDTTFGCMVAKDSQYKTIYDLKQKGVKVSRSMQSPSLDKTAREALPAFLGMTSKEVSENWTFVPAGSLVENARLVTDGRADVSVTVTVSSFMYELEGHPRGIRFLAMDRSDKEGWKRFLEARPAAIPVTIDMGVPSGIGVDGFTAPILYQVRMDEDPDLVYQLAKWLHENFDQYKDIHVMAQRMSLKYFRKFLDYCDWPVHEGTVRYLKEIGQWSEKDDEWNNEALALVDRWGSARKAALEEAKSQGVRMHWQNKELQDIIKKHTAGLPAFKARME